MTDNPQDLELKKELKEIDWKKYGLFYGVRLQIREGELKLTAIERTYPD